MPEVKTTREFRRAFFFKYLICNKLQKEEENWKRIVAKFKFSLTYILYILSVVLLLQVSRLGIYS